MIFTKNYGPEPIRIFLYLYKWSRINVIRTIGLFFLMFFIFPYFSGECEVFADETETSFESLLDDDFLVDENGCEIEIYDPLEPMNRFFFSVNDKLYFWAIKPVNKVYSAVLPNDIRGCLGNFFTNLSAPVRLLNNFLQGDFHDAGIVLSRFVINSTLGIFGFCDPATNEFELHSQPADFGQTLGKYGVGEGLFLYLPIIGPSNARDLVGYITDAYTHPVPYFSDKIIQEAVYFGMDKLNLISLNPGLYDDMKKFSLDPYVATREAYHDYRSSKIKEFINQQTCPPLLGE